MSLDPFPNNQILVTGTNTAGQTVTFPYPFIKDADLIVATVVTSTGVATTLASNAYTVTDTPNDGIVTSASIAITAAVPTTSAISVSTKYPKDASNDILRRWNDLGCPIDGVYSTDHPSVSLPQKTKKEDYSGKLPSSLTNP